MELELVDPLDSLIVNIDKILYFLVYVCSHLECGVRTGPRRVLLLFRDDAPSLNIMRNLLLSVDIDVPNFNWDGLQ